MPRRRKKKAAEQGGSPAWMTTYGDLVTLLLCFFILLFSYSVMDVAKFEQIIHSLQGTFLREQGILDSSRHPSTPEDDAMLDVEKEPSLELDQDAAEIFDEFYEVYLSVRSFLQEAGLDDDIKIRYEDRGIVLEMREAVLFDPGRADLKEDSLELLHSINLVLTQLPNKVLVEGHTDNVPINQPMFPSNWELSVIRATRVVRYLIENKGLEPERFVASGYGEYDPIDTNDTPEGRAHNRRVNIVISALETS